MTGSSFKKYIWKDEGAQVLVIQYIKSSKVIVLKNLTRYWNGKQNWTKKF